MLSLAMSAIIFLLFVSNISMCLGTAQHLVLTVFYSEINYFPMIPVSFSLVSLHRPYYTCYQTTSMYSVVLLQLSLSSN